MGPQKCEIFTGYNYETAGLDLRAITSAAFFNVASLLTFPQITFFSLFAAIEFTPRRVAGRFFSPIHA